MSDPQKREVVLKVANGTDVQKLAYSIQKNVEEGARVVISCLGLQSMNQGVKAVAIANGRTAQLGYVLMIYPVFHSETDPRNPDVEQTVLRFIMVKQLIGG